MLKLKNLFWQYPKIISAGAVGLLVVLGFVYLRSGNGEATIKVVRQDLVQTVPASGKLRALGQADLSFAKSGRVAGVYKQPGARVYIGETIAALDQADLLAERASAEATLRQAEAKLESYKIALADADRVLTNSVTKAFSTADTVMGTTIDELYDSPEWSSANLVIDFQGSSLRERLTTSRREAVRNLTNWEKELAAGTTDIVELAKKAEVYLDQFVKFLADLSFAVNYLDNLANEEAISEARETINSALSSLSTAIETHSAAPSNVAIQEGVVDGARASIAKIEAEIGKGLIRAPLSGLVTKQEARIGESVEANEILTSVIADNKNFEIESYIPEVNITKVAVGNPVKITFDALPRETFTGQVSTIDQGETIRDGVPNFKIKVSLKTDDVRVKTGLSANLIIETAKKEAVLVVPIYAVARQVDGRATVQVKDGNNVSTRDIVTGQTGDGGLVEVVSGLAEGELVLAVPLAE